MVLGKRGVGEEEDLYVIDIKDRRWTLVARTDLFFRSVIHMFMLDLALRGSEKDLFSLFCETYDF
jgi:hypothetical protein